MMLNKENTQTWSLMALNVPYAYPAPAIAVLGKLEGISMFIPLNICS